MLFKSKSSITFLLFVCLTLLSSTTVLGAITQDNSDFEGYYNLSEFQESSGETISNFQQAPILDERVESGKLPPVEDRLPEDPAVLVPWVEIGEYGGNLRWSAIGIDFDSFLRYFNQSFIINKYEVSGSFASADNYQPGIFSDWTIGPEAKEYTFTIRKGLKWSDGYPVTTEDVDYLINDEFRNEEVTSTPPAWLRWGGKKTIFNIIDEHTFQIVFAEPYGMFIEQGLTDPDYAWADILRPKHYLKQFHKDYADWEDILPLMEEEGYNEKADWAAFYIVISILMVFG